jgi:hypothetical protein
VPNIQFMLDCTVMVYDDQHHPGSGILVSRNDEGQERAFLVTAAHVLRLGGVPAPLSSQLVLREHVGAVWHEIQVNVPLAAAAQHPNPHFDLAAVEITPQLAALPNHAHQLIPIESLADDAALVHNGVRIGDPICVPCFPATAVAGAPASFGQGVRKWPLFRMGVLATPPREELQYPNGQLQIRGAVIECFVTPAASGCGVFLARDQQLAGDANVNPPLVLGVVIKTEWVPLTVGNALTRTYAGLGVAVDSLAARQLVEGI